MSYSSGHAAIRTRFSDQWGSRTPVAWPNTRFSTPDEGIFVKLVIQDADAYTAGLGGSATTGNLTRGTGAVTIMLYSEQHKGDGMILQHADFAAGVFRGWEDSGSGVFFRVPPFIRKVQDEKRWYRVNVVCPFEMDTFN